jgi:cytochrome d ubiquinol oxidase subunit I
MQNPVGAEFNYQTMRMELTSVGALIFNPVAQVKFVHTVAAGYVTAASFVLGISSWYLLRKRDVGFALRSFAVAAGFGLASTLSVIVLGDESGYTSGEVSKVKLAVIEAEWQTQKPPASFTLFGFPNQDAERTDYAIRIPYVMGIIASRSLVQPVTGIKELKAEHRSRIENGMIAYGALQKLRNGDKSSATVALFEQTKKDLGFGLLLKRYAPNVVDATPDLIRKAAENSIPQVAPMFWSFRIMVACGFTLLALFVLAFYYCARRIVADRTWLLKFALWTMPLPWIASEIGWVVAEYGRQPWTISGILPTYLSASNLSVGHLYFSLAGFIGFYTLLLIIEVWLMLKYIKLGPSCLGSGRYHHEAAAAGT